jgi:peptidoglycan hydrolase CwlO-like protein
MKKTIIASLIALLMTACVGTSIFVIGGAALLNKNGVTPSNSQAQLSQVSNVSSSNQAQIDQMQNLINQYQDREKQYQQREQQLQDQLAQANAQVQQDQQMVQQIRSLLAALQQRGLITVTNDGRILINR